MKNILAENMLRFGPKNLTESEKQNLQKLIEQDLSKDKTAIDIVGKYRKANGDYDYQKIINSKSASDIAMLLRWSNAKERGGMIPNDLEAVVEACFVAMANKSSKEFYNSVAKHLGKDPGSYIMTFMSSDEIVKPKLGDLWNFNLGDYKKRPGINALSSKIFQLPEKDSDTPDASPKNLISDENFNKLLTTLQDNGVPAKLGISPDKKSKFIWWGKWIIWQNTALNGGYSVYYKDDVPESQYKFAKPYAGEGYNEINLIQKKTNKIVTLAVAIKS